MATSNKDDQDEVNPQNSEVPVNPEQTQEGIIDDEHLETLLENLRAAGQNKKRVNEAKAAISTYFYQIHSNTYQSILQDIRSIVREEILSFATNSLPEILKPMEDILTKKIESTIQEKALTSPASPTTSYAEILKRTTEKPTLILAPKDDKLTLQKLEQALNKQISTKDLNIRTRRSRMGKLIVKTSDEETMTKLKQRLDALPETITYNIPKPRLQKLIIFNVPEINLKDQETEAIDEYKSNILLPAINRTLRTNLEDIQLDRSFATRDKNHSNIIITMEEQYAQQLLRVRSLTIGFNSCTINKYITIRRCTKCQSFNHQKHKCDHRPVCAICSDHHETSECKIDYTDKSSTKCINCIKENKNRNKGPKLPEHHPASWGGCPIYKKLLQEEIRHSHTPQQSRQ